MPIRLPFPPPAGNAPYQPRAVDLWLKANNTPQTGPLGFKRPQQRERKALVELPDFMGTARWPEEARYMLYSTAHWWNIANGYTRFYPPEYSSDFALYSQFPSQPAVEHMRARGISAVVVHLAEYSAEKQAELRRHPSLLRCFDSDCVFGVQ